MKRIASALSGLVILVLIQAPAATAQETLKIGFLGGFTGFLAPYDQPSLAGMEVAIDEINKGGGIGGTIPIELITRDTRSETAQAGVMTQELLAEDIDVLLTPCAVDASIAAVHLAQEKKIPAIAPCSSTPTLPGTGGEYMFILYPANNLQAAALAEFARQQGYETVYVLLSPDTPYTQSLPEYFMEAFEANGGEIVGVSEYTMGQQDFSVEATKLANLDPKPDAIMTSAYEPDFPAFIRQLRGAGVETPVLGSDGLDSPTTLALGDVVEGVVYTNAGYPSPGSPLEAFYERYEALHGEAADTAFTATGYEAIKVIEAAVQKAGSTDGMALRDALASLEDFESATGPITYAGRNRVPLRTVAINRIVDGQLEHLVDVVPDPATVPKP